MNAFLKFVQIAAFVGTLYAIKTCNDNSRSTYNSSSSNNRSNTQSLNNTQVSDKTHDSKDDLQRLEANFNSRLPQRIENQATVVRIEINNKYMLYHVVMDYSKDRFSEIRNEIDFESKILSVKQNYCEPDKFQILKENNIGLKYEYFSNDNDYLYWIEVNASDCLN